MRNAASKWLVLLGITLAWFGVNYSGLLDFIEERTIDWRFQYRGEVPGQGKLFYLDVDAKSIADIGNLAWDRSYYTEVCDAVLRAGGASAIGIDYVFSGRGMPQIADEKKFNEGSMRMAAFLFSEPPPPVVLAAGYASAQDRDVNGEPIVRELPRVLDPSRRMQPPELPQFSVGGRRIYTPPHIGLIDTLDGTMNRVPLFAPEGAKTWFNMSVELARLAWKLPHEAVHVHPDRVEFVRPDGAVFASAPLIDSQDIEVNWTTRWNSPQNPRDSFSNALVASRMLKSGSAEERAAAESFFARMKDAIVLIGPVDPLLQDRAPTRLDPLPVPRVGLIGNLVRMFQSGSYVRRSAEGWDWLLIAGLTAGVCALQLVQRGRWVMLGKIVAAALVVAYVCAVFWVFLRYNLILPLVTPLGSALSASFALTAMLLFAAERMRSRITGFFGAYVSPALVKRMIESGEEPQLGGVEVPITAYFSDIQNFTRVAESLPPARLVEFMNDYLSTATDVITAQDGTLDKYVGDGVVAMFGAPVACVDHAYRACVASQLVHAQHTEMNERWPDVMSRLGVRSQIGLCTGSAIVGNIGSRTRFNYTMMGDTVNIAARLENAARIFGVQTLVADATRKGAEKYGDRCVFRSLGRVVVKGRQNEIGIHEIMGLSDRLPAAAMECKRIFEEGMAKYLARDWDAAIELFARSAKLEWYPVMVPGQKTPSQVFLELSAACKARPPGGDWTGVYVLTTK